MLNLKNAPLSGVAFHRLDSDFLPPIFQYRESKFPPRMSPLVSPRWQIITTALLPAGFLTSLNLSGQLLMASWFTLNLKSAVSEGELGASGGAFKVLPSKNRGELLKKNKKLFNLEFGQCPE